MTPTPNPDRRIGEESEYMCPSCGTQDPADHFLECETCEMCGQLPEESHLIGCQNSPFTKNYTEVQE